jgi:hypothetical protein
MHVVFNGFIDERTYPIVQKLLRELKVDSFVYTFNYFQPNFGLYNKKATLIDWRKINFEETMVSIGIFLSQLMKS